MKVIWRSAVKIIFRLRHVWAGVPNSLTANPIMLAINEAGLKARQLSKDFILADGKVVALPMDASHYLHKIRREDRIESLPEKSHIALRDECNRLKKRDEKHGTFTPISPEFPLFAFTVGATS